MAEALQFSFTPVPQSAARNPAPPAPPASETADASPAATLAQARRVLEVALKVLED